MARGGHNNNNDNRFQAINTNSSENTVALELPLMDIGSPLFLHIDDHPCMILVSHLLTDANYDTWSRAMWINTKNKLGFIDGSIPQPKSGDINVGVWSQCNRTVTSWLLNSVSKEIAENLSYLDTAQAVWTYLYLRFRMSSAPRIFQMKQQLVGLSHGSRN